MASEGQGWDSADHGMALGFALNMALGMAINRYVGVVFPGLDRASTTSNSGTPCHRVLKQVWPRVLPANHVPSCPWGLLLQRMED